MESLIICNKCRLFVYRFPLQSSLFSDSGNIFHNKFPLVILFLSFETFMSFITFFIPRLFLFYQLYCFYMLFVFSHTRYLFTFTFSLEKNSNKTYLFRLMPWHLFSTLISVSLNLFCFQLLTRAHNVSFTFINLSYQRFLFHFSVFRNLLIFNFISYEINFPGLSVISMLQLFVDTWFIISLVVVFCLWRLVRCSLLCSFLGVISLIV